MKQYLLPIFISLYFPLTSVAADRLFCAALFGGSSLKKISDKPIDNARKANMIFAQDSQLIYLFLTGTFLHHSRQRVNRVTDDQVQTMYDAMMTAHGFRNIKGSYVFDTRYVGYRRRVSKPPKIVRVRAMVENSMKTAQTLITFVRRHLRDSPDQKELMKTLGTVILEAMLLPEVILTSKNFNQQLAEVVGGKKGDNGKFTGKERGQYKIEARIATLALKRRHELVPVITQYVESRLSLMGSDGVFLNQVYRSMLEQNELGLYRFTEGF